MNKNNQSSDLFRLEFLQNINVTKLTWDEVGRIAGIAKSCDSLGWLVNNYSDIPWLSAYSRSYDCPVDLEQTKVGETRETPPEVLNSYISSDKYES